MKLPSSSSSAPEAGWFHPDDWHGLRARVPDDAHRTVAGIVREHTAELATVFYDTLLHEERARPFLTHELVGQRLHGSLQQWLLTLFNDDEFDVRAVVALQEHVGQVHARIQLPITLVSRGARILKDAISTHLRQSPLGRESLSLAQQYVGGAFDLALEVMSTAYLRDARRDVRSGEAYRLLSLGQNVAAERERQRAALLEWSQQVLLQMHMAPEQEQLAPLRRSEFGLWMHHKGGASFEGSPELAEIRTAMSRLDNDIVPALFVAARQGGTTTAQLARTFHDEIDQIQFLLVRLFERLGEIESGRDPLTQLLNRRFIPTVMTREIALTRQESCGFAVLLIDLDHFKKVNDGHGHEGGDAVLRQAAELLLDRCRSGDYVFRYGGEEFLVILVDIAPVHVATLAEELCQALRNHVFRLPRDQNLRVTASIGVAVYDGHPDPQRLIQLADKRLYQAKRAGRNQVVIV
ncbi:MAG: diguanylate cyclase [Pigmentiphaga sp.]|nr:diguanylate cyclase [Pigmentiphaga sp.]